MTDRQFRDLVRRMRETQDSYFKTRDSIMLRAAKDYERRVDAELAAPSEGLFDEKRKAGV